MADGRSGHIGSQNLTAPAVLSRASATRSIVGPERLLLRDSTRLESGTKRTRQARTQNVADDPSTDVRVGSNLTQRLQKDLGLLYGVAAS